jgi:hypothetical protein
MSKFIHVIGTEAEHDVWDPTGEVKPDKVLKMLEPYAARLGYVKGGTLWGTNGSRNYGDAHMKVESAGPETRTGRQAARYELAGSFLWALMALMADLELGRTGTTLILKTNTSTNATTGGGNHVNISMPLSSGQTFDQAFREAVSYLQPFIATLQLLTGSGVVIPRVDAKTRLGGDQYSYGLSPRGFHIIEDYRGAASTAKNHDKPLFMARPEHHADVSQIWRFQICGLDSNILPRILEFKLDLLLFMAEMAAQKILKPFKLVKEAGRPHPAMLVSLDWRSRLQTDLGQSTTALEVQRDYLKQALSWCGPTPLIDRWSLWLDQFDTDDDVPLTLFGIVDWVTKLVTIQREERKKGFNYKRAEDLHFLYQGYRFSSKKECMPLRNLRRHGEPGILNQVWHAMHTPPDDTRAWGRGRLIAARPPDLTSVDWSRLLVGGNTLDQKYPDRPTTDLIEKVIGLGQKRPS